MASKTHNPKLSIGLLVGLCFIWPEMGRSQLDTLAWDYVVNQKWEIPILLIQQSGVHPRLLFNAAKIESLKVWKETSHRFIWDNVRQVADEYLERQPNNSPGDEDSTRADGDALPWLSLAFLVSEDTRYLNKAVSWMETVCGYDQWDSNNSLAAGHCLLGVSLAYDWLYYDLTVAQRDYIRSRIEYFAEQLALNPKHKERYLSNHCQVEYTALAAAGFALFDAVPAAETWLQHSCNIFQEAFQIFGEDGSSTEGHQYWGLMTEFQMYFVKMAADLLGRNYYQSSEWLQNLGDFILYSSLPDLTPESNVMRFGDTKYYHYNTHGPIYQLWNVASAYQESRWQWLAGRMSAAGVGIKDRMGWSSLLWYDPGIPDDMPAELTTTQLFEDTGWFTSRSSWDSDAIMVGFKCGPFHGAAVQDLYDRMTSFHQLVNGHGHPDVNHFNIYAYGKWLVTDDGYPEIKWTRNHSTLMVNDEGQLGEGTRWLNRQEIFDAGARSRITHFESTDLFDYLVGDAGNIYPASSGLQTFKRHFLYLKPDVIILVDELVASVESTFDWLLQTRGIITANGQGSYLLRNDDVEMDIHFHWPAQMSRVGPDSILQMRPTVMRRNEFIVTVMHPRRIGTEPAQTNLVSMSDSLVVIDISTTGFQDRVTLNFRSGKVRLGVVTGSLDPTAAPVGFPLEQNYQNPFNTSTTIVYSVPEGGYASLAAYDLLGREVAVIDAGSSFPGRNAVSWAATDLSSGTYLYSLLNYKGNRATRKMIVLNMPDD